MKRMNWGVSHVSNLYHKLHKFFLLIPAKKIFCILILVAVQNDKLWHRNDNYAVVMKIDFSKLLIIKSLNIMLFWKVGWNKTEQKIKILITMI